MIKSRVMFASLGALLILLVVVGLAVNSTYRLLLLSLFMWTAVLALGVVLYVRNLSKSHSTGLRNGVRKLERQILELDVAISKGLVVKIDSMASDLGGVAQRLDRDLSGISDSLTSMKLELKELALESRKSRDAVTKDTGSIISSQESTSAELRDALDRLQDLNVELVASLDKRLEGDRL